MRIIGRAKPVGNTCSKSAINTPEKGLLPFSNVFIANFNQVFGYREDKQSKTLVLSTEVLT